MAYGDFLDLAELACRRAQRDPTVTRYLTDAKRAVNQAHLHALGGLDEWEFLQAEGDVTLTAGAGAYAFTAIATAIGVDAIDRVLQVIRDGSQAGGVIPGMSWQQLEVLAQSTQDGDATGEPVAWASMNGTLRVWPAPDQAYTFGIVVRQKPSVMTADADTPLVPVEFRDPVLVNYAAAMLLQHDGGADKAARARDLMALHQQALMDMRARWAQVTKERFVLVSPGLESGIMAAEGGDWLN